MRPHHARLRTFLLSVAFTAGCTGDAMGGDPTLGASFDDPALGPELDPGLRPGGGDPGSFNDRDGDGLADVEEIDTDAGAADTDGDGIGDLVETVYDRAFCATDHGACKCAASAVCEPPSDFIAVVLPFGDHSATRRCRSSCTSPTAARTAVRPTTRTSAARTTS